MNIDEAKEQALKARLQYNAGEILRGEADKLIKPYKELFNKKSEEIAMKYNQKPQRFSTADFLRNAF